MQTLLHLAILCGLAGVLAGDRTAVALVVNVGACLALQRAEVEFDVALWMTIDVLVAMAIVRPDMRPRDWFVVGLFGVAFVFYQLPDPWRYFGSVSVSITQLLLTFPATPVLEKLSVFIARVRASAQPFDELIRALFPVRFREAM
jgi:hypothetical protein